MCIISISGVIFKLVPFKLVVSFQRNVSSLSALLLTKVYENLGIS